MARRHIRIGAVVVGAVFAVASHAAAETLFGAGAVVSHRSNVPGPIGGEVFAGWNAPFQGFGVQSWYVYMPEDAGLHTVAVQGGMLSPTRGFGIKLRFTLSGGVATTWTSSKRPFTPDASTRVQPVASVGTLMNISEHTLVGARANIFFRPGTTEGATPSPHFSGSVVLLWRP